MKFNSTNKGIIVVIEERLPGTYLDGASILGPDDYPIIRLTLCYDQIDHFGFVLFHELAYIFLHLFEGVYCSFGVLSLTTIHLNV